MDYGVSFGDCVMVEMRLASVRRWGQIVSLLFESGVTKPEAIWVSWLIVISKFESFLM